MSDELSKWFDDFGKKNAGVEMGKGKLVAIPTARGHILATCPRGEMCKCALVELKRPDGSGVFAPPEAMGL